LLKGPDPGLFAAMQYVGIVLIYLSLSRGIVKFFTEYLRAHQ